MKIKFEEFDNPQILNRKTSPNPKTLQYKGKKYTYIGKTKENAGLLNRGKSLLECFLMTLAAGLVVPFFFKGFRKTYKIAGSELISGQETIKHYVLKPGVFPPENKKPWVPPTAAESFQKGVNDANNATKDPTKSPFD